MVDGPVTNRRFSRRQVRQALLLGGGLVVIVLIIVGGWSAYKFSISSSAKAGKQQIEAQAKEIANSISAKVGETAGQLKTLAQNPKTIAAFEDGDTDALDSAAETQRSSFAHGILLRLLVPGHYEMDSTMNPPLSFASLDMLRQAERSTGPVSAEVHMFGKPEQHIVMVQQVNNKGSELIGLLHLSLSLDYLQQIMSGLTVGNAYVEIRQAASGRELAIAKTGNESFQGGEAVVTGINGTRWNLVYWAGSAAGNSKTAWALPANFFPVVIVLLIIGAVLFVLRGRSSLPGKTSAGEHQIVYGGAVQAIMDGAHPGMERLVPNLPGMGQKKPIKSVSQGMVGDDVTMIMNAEQLKAEAQASGDFLDLTAAEEKPAVKKKQPVKASPPNKARQAPAPAAQQAPAPAASTAPAPAPNVADASISPSIFRTYDIRGVVGKTLTKEAVTRIGQAIGSDAASKGQSAVIVGRDGRLSSPELSEALITGIRAAGRNVIDIGVVPTPLLYFATNTLDSKSGAMLTGSHNGPEYNGIKIVINGETLSEESIQALHNRITQNDMESGQGNLVSTEIIADYVRRVSEDIPVALGGALKLVVDCGNGVAGAVAPQLFRALGHDVIELFCDIDGNFPNHHPDPCQPENLQDLIAKVKEEQADMGLAFDGDGDRLGVVDGEGNIIWPDRQLMVLAKDVLTRNPGASIIYDVKCSRYLKAIIEASGGKALMWKTGHSLIKNKMKEVDSPLSGELSGHIFFKERWYGFDDAMYTAARLIEIIMNAKSKPAEIFAEIPQGVTTPELRVDMSEEVHKTFIEDFKSKMSFTGAEIIDIDGVRVEYEDRWGLIRPSNTSPCMVLRFEAENQEGLDNIKEEFRSLIQSINPELKLTF